MRQWQRWWRSTTIIVRQCPPRFVEAVMLLLAAALCAIWFFMPEWQFLILWLSYIVGAIASILVREAITPSMHTKQVRVTAVLSLLLLLSLTLVYVTRAAQVKALGF